MEDYEELLDDLDDVDMVFGVERVFRDRGNPFDMFSDYEFIRRFRFSKECAFIKTESTSYEIVSLNRSI